ncbi:transcriptional regulator [Tardiphaga robiniae]|uniref:transcriptional regulator n=1 Tax=Tardiphaga robiniae TaxID=943830 RepID=UPI0015861CCD|nr:YdaS family helix-turn-helix protein [Tardiphaga robiniae]NUU41406.1 transcriptional regulator [Tardiphaga robiniae]
MIRELIQEAVRILGSQAKLGAACGVTQASIWQAMEVQRCSAELAMAIEQATNGQVRAAALRPDLPWPAQIDQVEASAISEVTS